MSDNINNDETVDEPMERCHISDCLYPVSEMRLEYRTEQERWSSVRFIAWRASTPADVPDSDSSYVDYRNNRVYVWDEIETTLCEDCGELRDEEETDDLGGCVVCNSCRDSSWRYCDSHDTWYHCDNYCYSCDEDEDEYGSSLIHDYGFRPAPMFYLTNTINRLEPRNTSVTGFELEMECEFGDIDDCAQLATDLFPQTYLKHDGSLDRGFEMVSHPMTLDYINGAFDFEALRQLADAGMRSARTRTCGLHVHLNKGFFRSAPTTAYRFMQMFYRNAEMWRALAGRSNSSYAQWDLGEQDNMLGYTRSMADSLRTGNYNYFNRDRYVAVNLQPSHTIELRFFKGTLRPLTMQARLQAVHAVAEFAMSTKYKVNIKESASWEQFRNFTTDNAKKFGAFNTYASEKGV